MARSRTPRGFEMVRAIAASLPDVEDSTSWGEPSLKLRGRLLTCMASHKSAEPNTLVVLIGFDQRDAMIADDPGTYYLKPHYENYECVLVRLAKVRRDALDDLLHASWRFVDATAPRRRRIVSTPQLSNSQRPINSQHPTPKTPKVRSRRPKRRKKASRS